MAKKKIKATVIIGTDPYKKEEVEGELYSTGGLSFILYHRNNRLFASELRSGYDVYIDKDTYGYKKKMISFLNKAVANGYIQKRIQVDTEYVNRRRMELEQELSTLPKFPLNEL
jgi:hypothetical protein